MMMEYIQRRGLEHPQHLGDGAYVAHDGYQIWLLAERDDHIDKVALEPCSLAALVAYAKQRGIA